MDDNTERDARAWRMLREMLGHWQDGSDQLIKLTQDDATRRCLVIFVRGPIYDAASFERAIELAHTARCPQS